MSGTCLNAAKGLEKVIPLLGDKLIVFSGQKENDPSCYRRRGLSDPGHLLYCYP